MSGSLPHKYDGFQTLTNGSSITSPDVHTLSNTLTADGTITFVSALYGPSASGITATNDSTIELAGTLHFDFPGGGVNYETLLSNHDHLKRWVDNRRGRNRPRPRDDLQPGLRHDSGQYGRDRPGSNQHL